MQDFIELAGYLADEAGEIIRPYFRQSFDVETKADDSPVTIADHSVEKRLRALIEERRPEDGIIGEEFGIKPSQNQYDWVLDPIDGTKSFIAGRPTFGTLIALCEEGIPILGIIDQPIAQERWIGAKGMPTTFNGQQIQTRQCSSIEKAYGASTAPIMFDDRGIRFEQACQSVTWGGDCYSYGLLASGFLDIVAESDMGTYDYAALPPIVEGAGGLMCDWYGAPLNIKSQERSTVLALGYPSLKSEMLNFLKK